MVVHTSSPEDVVASASLLRRNRDFRRYWLGETVSAFGSQVTILAIPLLAVESLDASATRMGLLGAMQTLPVLLFAIPAGLWIDRHRQRPLLVAANAGRAGLLAMIPLLAWLGMLRFWHLLVIAFLVGTCAIGFEIASQAFLPRIVARDDLVEANSRLSASTSVAEVGGPGLGGFLVGLLSAPLAIALDVVSFLVAAASIRGMRRSEPAPEQRPGGERLLASLRSGAVETFRNRYLLAFAGEAATYNVAWGGIMAIIVLWAVREIGIGAGTLGMLLATGTVGALLGAMATDRVGDRIGIGRAMWGFAVLSNCGVLVLALAPGHSGPAIAVLAAGFFVRGIGETGTNVQTYAIRQAVTPAALLGRTTAVYRLLTHSLVPAGALLGGILADQVGLRPAFLILALLLFPSWLWLWCSPARTLRTLPTASR